MRIVLCLLPLALLAAPAPAQDETQPPGDMRMRTAAFMQQERKAFANYNKQEWDAAVAAFERQIAIFGENPRPYYNIACCYGLQGDAERSATWLSLAVRMGWRDLNHVQSDSDFNKVRNSRGHQGCLEQLAQARRNDPEPLPRNLDPVGMPLASSAAALLGSFRKQEQALDEMSGLLSEGAMRRKLFALLDEKRARLTRYLMENGDARDADWAAYGRVEAAEQYLKRARSGNAADKRLLDAAAALVLQMSDEFELRWAGSHLLGVIRLTRANALRRSGKAAPEELQELYRTTARDFPDSSVGPRAMCELCAYEAEIGALSSLRRDYAELQRRWGRTPLFMGAGRRLMKARLLVEGLPDLPELDLDQNSIRDAGLQSRPLMLVVVATDSRVCEERLPALLKLAQKHEPGGLDTVVACIDDIERVPVDATLRWMGVHARGVRQVPQAGALLTSLWIQRVPTVIVATASGRVLAVNPDDETLARSLQRIARVSEERPAEKDG